MAESYSSPFGSNLPSLNVGVGDPQVARDLIEKLGLRVPNSTLHESRFTNSHSQATATVSDDELRPRGQRSQEDKMETKSECPMLVGISTTVGEPLIIAGTSQQSDPVLVPRRESSRLSQDSSLQEYRLFGSGEPVEPTASVEVKPFSRFRYGSEITEKSGQKQCRTSDAIEDECFSKVTLNGFTGRVTLIAYCSDKDGKFHPYSLSGDHCSEGIFQHCLDVSGSTCYKMKHVQVIQPTAKEFKDVLQKRIVQLAEVGASVMKANNCFDAVKKNSEEKDMVYLTVEIKQDNRLVLVKTSSPIMNKKIGEEFKIHRVTPVSAPATGFNKSNIDGTRVMIVLSNKSYCPKKEALEVIIFDEEHNWKVPITDFSLIRNAVIEFTPVAYRNQAITKPVEVVLYLQHKSTGLESDKVPFTYRPVCAEDEERLARKKRKMEVGGQVFSVNTDELVRQQVNEQNMQTRLMKVARRSKSSPVMKSDRQTQASSDTTGNQSVVRAETGTPGGDLEMGQENANLPTSQASSWPRSNMPGECQGQGQVINGFPSSGGMSTLVHTNPAEEQDFNLRKQKAQSLRKKLMEQQNQRSQQAKPCAPGINQGMSADRYQQSAVFQNTPQIPQNPDNVVQAGGTCHGNQTSQNGQLPDLQKQFYVLVNVDNKQHRVGLQDWINAGISLNNHIIQVEESDPSDPSRIDISHIRCSSDQPAVTQPMSVVQQTVLTEQMMTSQQASSVQQMTSQSAVTQLQPKIASISWQASSPVIQQTQPRLNLRVDPSRSFSQDFNTPVTQSYQNPLQQQQQHVQTAPLVSSGQQQCFQSGNYQSGQTSNSQSLAYENYNQSMSFRDHQFSSLPDTSMSMSSLTNFNINDDDDVVIDSDTKEKKEETTRIDQDTSGQDIDYRTAPSKSL